MCISHLADLLQAALNGKAELQLRHRERGKDSGFAPLANDSVSAKKKCETLIGGGCSSPAHPPPTLSPNLHSFNSDTQPLRHPATPFPTDSGALHSRPKLSFRRDHRIDWQRRQRRVSHRLSSSPNIRLARHQFQKRMRQAKCRFFATLAHKHTYTHHYQTPPPTNNQPVSSSSREQRMSGRCRK